MNTKYKIDIFEVLSNIAIKNRTFYNNLLENERKHVPLLLVQRWMSNSYNSAGKLLADQIVLLNHFVNPYIFTFMTKRGEIDHTSLLYLLLTAVSTSTHQNSKWLKCKGKKEPTQAIKILAEYLEYSTNQAKEVINLYEQNEIIEMANELGYQDDVLNALKKEYKGKDD